MAIRDPHPHLRAVPDEPAADTDWLATIAASVAGRRSMWEAHSAHDPGARHAYLLVATETYDVWLIDWSPGQGLPLHDHGESVGAFTVAAGRLIETHHDTDDGELALRALTQGDTVAFDRGHVHGVVNLDDRPATSIHVYSPPLTAMTFFDESPGAARPTRVERY